MICENCGATYEEQENRVSIRINGFPCVVYAIERYGKHNYLCEACLEEWFRINDGGYVDYVPTGRADDGH